MFSILSPYLLSFLLILDMKTSNTRTGWELRKSELVAYYQITIIFCELAYNPRSLAVFIKLK